jgi:hypothetical protein
LSLILGEVTDEALVILDTTRLHVERAAALAWPA